MRHNYIQLRKSVLSKQFQHRLAVVGDGDGAVTRVEFPGWIDAEGGMDGGVEVGQ